MPIKDIVTLDKIRVVTLGGGSGQFTLLSAMRDVSLLDTCAVVSMTDSGGSTGKLRDELGILPPGDILKCLLALSPHRDIARKLLLTRFSKVERLAGHNAGNMLLTMLGQYAGSFAEGVKGMSEMLDVKGRILPVTTDRATLVAELSSGERVFGERAIDVPRNNVRREKIESVYLVPHHSDNVSAYPPALAAIAKADAIVMGPGDLYTSLIPNLLVPGISDAIRNSSAKLVYICNIMTKFGETDGFRVEDFLDVVEQYSGRAVDTVVCNSGAPSAQTRERYLRYGAELVGFRQQQQLPERAELIYEDLLEERGGVIRHSVPKLARLLLSRLRAATSMVQ